MQHLNNDQVKISTRTSVYIKPKQNLFGISSDIKCTETNVYISCIMPWKMRCELPSKPVVTYPNKPFIHQRINVLLPTSGVKSYK